MRVPKFSVVIPTLNEEKYLPRLLDSLVRQTQKNFEVIVIDGKSKDNTLSVAKGYAKKLPQYYAFLLKHANTSLQRNEGAKRARGEWLVFLDADSIVLPFFFERIEQFITKEHPHVFTAWSRSDSEQPSDALTSLLINMYIEGSILFKRPVSPGPLTIIEKGVFDKVGGYDLDIKFAEDYDLTRRIVARGYTCTVLRDTLYVYSLRHVRKIGKLKFFQTFTLAAIPVIFTKRSFRSLPWYETGGQVYSQSAGKKKTPFRLFERKIKAFMKELTR